MGEAAEKIQGADDRVLSQDQLLQELQISYPTLYRWKAEGCPAMPIGGRQSLYHLGRVRQWMLEKGYTGKVGRPSKDLIPEELKLEIAEAKLRKENLLAERHKFALDVAKKAVVSVQEVNDGRLRRVMAVKAGLLALPGKLAQRLALRPAPEVQAELEREVHQLLEAFSQDKVVETTATGGVSRL